MRGLALDIGLRLTGLAPGAGGGGAPVLPTRVVANGPYSALSHNNQVSSWTSTMTRMTFYAATDLTSIQLAYANFRNLDSAGVSSSVVMAVSASIEYPAGTVLAQVLFSGSSDGSIPKGDILISDAVSVSIPKDAAFYVRTYQHSGSYCMLFPANRTGDWWKLNGGVDETMTIGSAGSTSTYTFGPFAIIGPSNAPAIGIPGDSIGAGSGGSASSYFKGTISPTLAQVNAAHLNFSIPGLYVNVYLSHLRPVLTTFMQSYTSHICCQLGYNDISGGNTTTDGLKARLEALYANFPDQTIIQSTLIPSSTSTDSWATDANQTIRYTADNPTYIGFDKINGYIRGIAMVGQDDYVETYNALVSPTADNKWWNDGSTANLATADGIHPSQASADRVVAQATIDRTKFGLAA